MTNCPNCKTPNPPDAKFCKTCGYGLPIVAQAQPPVVNPAPANVMMACPSCQSLNKQGVKFCNKCGKSMLAQPIPVVAPPPQPQGIFGQAAQQPPAPIQAPYVPQPAPVAAGNYVPPSHLMGAHEAAPGTLPVAQIPAPPPQPLPLLKNPIGKQGLLIGALGMCLCCCLATSMLMVGCRILPTGVCSSIGMAFIVTPTPTSAPTAVAPPPTPAQAAPPQATALPTAQATVIAPPATSAPNPTTPQPTAPAPAATKPAAPVALPTAKP